MTGTAVEIHEGGRLAAPVRLEDMKTFLARMSSPAALEEQQQLAIAYDRAVASLIGPNDEQIDGDRKFKKKSAWRKLGRHFTISTFVVSSKIDYVADPEVDSDRELILVATVVVRGVAVWGQSSEAIGVCATDEESGQRVITIADALATAETRATNRAISNLIAMGEVSAEEISRSDGSSRTNGPPTRKERPAEEIKMPFGPSKGTLLGDMESGDLAGALRWAEDRSEEKGQIQFADFQKAAKQVIENRKKATATQLHPDDPRRQSKPDPAAESAKSQDITLEEALALPFPFNRGESNHGKPMFTFGSDHLREVKKWIHEKQGEKGDEEWHRKTARAIELILAEREKDQIKLDLRADDDVVQAAGGDPAATPAKSDSLPSQSSQEAETPAPATEGGRKRAKPGKVSDALEPDPTSRMAYNDRIKKALQSPAITPETRQLYAQDNINGFKKPAKSLEWWVEKLESIASKDPNSFPSALEDTARPGKDGLPF